jgi:hypothetical protein
MDTAGIQATESNKSGDELFRDRDEISEVVSASGRTVAGHIMGGLAPEAGAAGEWTVRYEIS